jgi:glycosyltransferase involved in cell wall biosynthesis
LRTVLFHRKYRRFHGGHLKVWHYFNHVLTAPGFDARVLFDVDSAWDSSNPWNAARARVIDRIDDVVPGVLFVAGRDWQRLDTLGLLDRGLPVLNLIQHVRHADDWSIQSRYLGQRAIRICVSQEVADAVTAAGSQGPVVVIPNGVDVPLLAPVNGGERQVDLLVAGLKQPAMANRAAAALAVPGRTIEVLTENMRRESFLAELRRARVTLFLPNEEEGFYLPALEGMALGTVVVCPDCVGNRSFCLPGVNAFRPEFTFDRLVEATEEALAMGGKERAMLLAGAWETARLHSSESERAAFHRVLGAIDRLWAEG